MDTFTVVSFQGSEVLDILTEEGVYRADLSLAREKRTYVEDIIQLNGRVPIWVYDMTDIGHKLDPSCWLFTLRCELSINPDLLPSLVLLELEIPYDIARVGKTHNANRRSLVIPELRKEWLRAAYRVTEDGDGIAVFHIEPLLTSDRCMFTEELTLSPKHADEVCFKEFRYHINLDKNLNPTKVDSVPCKSCLSTSITLMDLPDGYYANVEADNVEEALVRTKHLIKHFERIRNNEQ